MLLEPYSNIESAVECAVPSAWLSETLASHALSAEDSGRYSRAFPQNGVFSKVC
jgi:hypothetical protein